jgi:hypothetical protein
MPKLSYKLQKVEEKKEKGEEIKSPKSRRCLGILQDVLCSFHHPNMTLICNHNKLSLADLLQGHQCYLQKFPV